MAMGKGVMTGGALSLASRGRIPTRFRDRRGSFTSTRSGGARPAEWPSGSGPGPQRVGFGDIFQYRPAAYFTPTYAGTIGEAQHTAYS
jgi:hypothetical protein